MTLSFVDDFPIVPMGNYYALGQSGVNQDGYTIDDIAFSQFGAYILKGTDDSIRKLPNVRSNLSINIKSIAGIQYDSEFVTFKSKDVSIKMLINTESIEEFWKRWNSLWAVMLQPEERIFVCDTADKEYECYYKSNTVSKFDILNNGHVWCEFTITLAVTAYGDKDTLLITEDGNYIITEGSMDTKIIIMIKQPEV